MRVLGYVILLLLALYFILVKPYLMVKRIEVELEGLRISFGEGIAFKSFLLFLPLRDLTLHVYIKNARLMPWQVEAEEFSLLEVSSKPPTDKPFDYDFSPLLHMLQRANIKLGGAYISTNYLPYRESLTLFIPSTELSKGRLIPKGLAKVYYQQELWEHALNVSIEEAELEGGKLFVKKAQVESSLYNFELNGVWEGRSGSYRAEGYVEDVEGKAYRLGRIKASAEGNITYTKIRAKFRAYSPELEIKGRKTFRELTAEGEYVWVWRSGSQVKVDIGSGKTRAKLIYWLSKKELIMDFSQLPLDGGLLRVDKHLFALLSGRLKVNLEKGLLDLEAYTPEVVFEDKRLRQASLKLELDYRRELKGKLDLSVAEPFLLSLKGSFLRRDFSGTLQLVGYELRSDKLSTRLSYMGSLFLKEGKLYTQGEGRLSNITYDTFRLGPADYRLTVEGEDYKIDLHGEGYSLGGGGSIRDRSFMGNVLFEGFATRYGNYQVSGLRGKVEVSAKEERVSLKGFLEGMISSKDIILSLSSHFNLNHEMGHLGGSFEGRVEGLKAFGLNYEKGSFNGRLEDKTVAVAFNLQDRLTGEGFYNLLAKRYKVEGRISENLSGLLLTAKYHLGGVGDSLSASILGRGLYKGLEFPVDAELSLRESSLSARVEGFSLKRGLFELSVGGIRAYGSRQKGFLEVLPIKLSMGKSPITSINFERGSYRDKEVSLRGFLEGAVEGKVELSYREGFLIRAEGSATLSKLLSLVKSRILASAEGRLKYRLLYSKSLEFWIGSDDLWVRSRYLALPMRGGFELSLSEDRLKGYLNLRGNEIASLSASFSGRGKSASVDVSFKNLPILYRGEGISASLLAGGNAYISSDFKSLDIKGRVETSGTINLLSLPRSKTAPLEDYRRINLHVSIRSFEPLRINLPEGYVYSDLSALLEGNLYEPKYTLKAELKGGRLKYFDREFYLRRGFALFTDKEKNVDLTLATSLPDYNILIDIKGNPQYPKAVIRSEPPRDMREVLTALIAGGKEEAGFLSLGGAIASQIPEAGFITKGIQRLTGVDIKLQVSPYVSPTGDVGINASVSKDITERVSVEYKQSTSKDPKETYTGGDLKLTPNTSLGGRVYSDRTQEVRLRVRKKFDF